MLCTTYVVLSLHHGMMIVSVSYLCECDKEKWDSDCDRLIEGFVV